MVIGYNRDSSLKIDFEVFRIYERCRKNLNVIDLGSRGKRNGSCEYYYDSLVVRIEI